MSSLPKDPFTLKGGCFCSAIRYTVSVPEFSARQKLPAPAEKDAIDKQNGVPDRLPSVEVDFCHSCRRVSAAIVQLWMMVPYSWVQFSLQPRTTITTSSGVVVTAASNNDASNLKPKTLEVITGAPEIASQTHVSKFSSSEGVNRIFCNRCGTNLTFHYGKLSGSAKEAKERQMEWDPTVDLALGSLDQEFLEWEALRPTERVHEVDGAPWIKRWLKEGEKALIN